MGLTIRAKAFHQREEKLCLTDEELRNVRLRLLYRQDTNLLYFDFDDFYFNTANAPHTIFIALLNKQLSMQETISVVITLVWQDGEIKQNPLY